MSLPTGARIGPYEVLAKLGEGGMGQVYRARDPKLGRAVALKILPDAYARDPERLARFRREAQALAALNHPHIGQIYGFEEALAANSATGTICVLVLELIEGPTLAELIATRGNGAGLGVTDAVAIARQITDALDAAHARGIVHRDLKPANIKVRVDPDDQSTTIKVLDFGLAKALAPDDESISEVANSPTITSPAYAAGFGAQATAQGVILGTAGYMSPEQALGRRVDRRADIWAFGVILFEMLAGRRPFQGGDIGTALTETITADLDLTPLPAATPASVRRLLRRCLEKNPRQRLRDIGDARHDLDERDDAGSRVAAMAPAPPPRAGWQPWLGWIAAGGFAAALLTLSLLPKPAASSEVAPAVRFFVSPPKEGSRILEVALSPTGTTLAMLTTARDPSSIWIRDLANPVPRELPSTLGASGLFWTADGKSIGFYADKRLQTIDLTSGVQSVVCDLEQPTQVAVAPGGAILYGDAKGIGVCGEKRFATTTAGQEVAHRSPAFLPDGEHFVYLAHAPATAELRIGSLKAGGSTAVIGPSDSQAVYSSGHLLFTRSGALLALPFDVQTLTAKGEPFRVGEDFLGVLVATRRSSLTASRNGIIAFAARDDRPSQLTWVNRKGTPVGTVGKPGSWANFNLSPTEDRLAVSQRTLSSRTSDIWIIDLQNGAELRLTTDPAAEYDPVFSPDGRWVVFNSHRLGTFDLYRRRADGSGADELLLRLPGGLTTPVWFPNEDRILVTANLNLGNADLLTLPFAAGAKETVFLATPVTEAQPAFSPDGKWLAYESHVSARREIVLRAVAAGGSPTAVSLAGGQAPRWRADGGEIYFIAPGGMMMAARIGFDAGVPRVDKPEELFRTNITLADGHPYVVTKDGRFLLSIREGGSVATGVWVISNWPAAPRATAR